MYPWRVTETFCCVPDRSSYAAHCESSSTSYVDFDFVHMHGCGRRKVAGAGTIDICRSARECGRKKQVRLCTILYMRRVCQPTNHL